jgi:hypothetical protein
MNKKVYVLTDGSGEIFDARFMDQAEYEAEQQKANEATDGTFGWINAQSYYAAAAGSVTSERKAASSRENGKKGGRPQAKVETVKERRVKVADEYSASGYGRSRNHRNVYLIDGYYYAYHPEYAKQAFQVLTGELVGYVAVNQMTLMTLGDIVFYAECNARREGHNCHRPAK